MHRKSRRWHPTCSHHTESPPKNVQEKMMAKQLKKLSLSKETVKGLKVKSQLKTGQGVLTIRTLYPCDDASVSTSYGTSVSYSYEVTG
jgi:hypothetical protein